MLYCTSDSILNKVELLSCLAKLLAWRINRRCYREVAGELPYQHLSFSPSGLSSFKAITPTPILTPTPPWALLLFLQRGPWQPGPWQRGLLVGW